MTFFHTFRAVWITCIAWLLLVTLNQITRGYSIVPAQIDAFDYWALHLIIGGLLGCVVWVILATGKTMRGMKK